MKNLLFPTLAIIIIIGLILITTQQKKANINIKHSATPVEVLLEEAKNSTILIPDNFYIGEGNSNILDTFTNEIVLDPRWAQSQEKLLNKILIEQIYTNLGLQTSNSINIKCKTTICLVTTKLDSEESLSKLIREIVRFLDKNEKKYYFDPVKLLPQDTILAFTPIKNEV